MRVLLINKFHYLKGGAERTYFDTARILADHGHDLAFFSMRHELNRSSRWARYFIAGVDYNQPMGAIKKIKAAFNIFYNWEARRNLERLIKDFKPDVAHFHNIYHQLSFSIITALQKNNIPMVMTLHDHKLVCPNYNLFTRGRIWEKSQPDKYYRCFLDKCVKDSYVKSLVCTLEAYWHKFIKIYDQIDVFIAPSRHLIKKFSEFNFAREIKYIPNPLMNIAKAKDNCKHADKYILYFGRLSEEKGVGDLVAAYGKIKTGHKLYIVGDGPERSNLEFRIENLELTEKVSLFGHKSGDDLWDLVKNAAVIVMPSRCYENAPYSVLEAMSLGQVVIAPRLGGLPDMIKDGETGYLYKAGDSNDLAMVIKKVINNPQDINKKIGQQASKVVKERHGREIYYQSLMKIYQRIFK